jgi:protein gp37
MRVSPACDRCYAAAIAKRFGWRGNEGRDLWDVHAERKRTSEAYWRGPLRWNRDALAAGERRRVFCASMADIFDNHAPAAWRMDLWDLIRATPALIWVLLSKRPQTAPAMLPPDWGDGWPNVWLGKLHWVICGGESGVDDIGATGSTANTVSIISAVATPEPSTISLLAAGIAGLLLSGLNSAGLKYRGTHSLGAKTEAAGNCWPPNP